MRRKSWVRQFMAVAVLVSAYPIGQPTQAQAVEVIRGEVSYTRTAEGGTVQVITPPGGTRQTAYRAEQKKSRSTPPTVSEQLAVIEAQNNSIMMQLDTLATDLTARMPVRNTPAIVVFDPSERYINRVYQVQTVQNDSLTRYGYVFGGDIMMPE